MQARWAKELVVGYARLDGRVIGIVANQPKQKGGVLFVDSADKAARFIMTCNAFNVPLLFLADVPGFMIGKAVESQGIIRHGAKMISAVSTATVPKLSVIVRKAYGAGLYAMAGPAFEPDACIALPGAKIAVMGPEAAVNAVYFNQIEAIEDEAERAEFVERKREEFSADVDILHLASELVIDTVIEPDELRAELIRRYAEAEGKDRSLHRAHEPDHPRLSETAYRQARIYDRVIGNAAYLRAVWSASPKEFDRLRPASARRRRGTLPRRRLRDARLHRGRLPVERPRADAHRPAPRRCSPSARSASPGAERDAAPGRPVRPSLRAALVRDRRLASASCTASRTSTGRSRRSPGRSLPAAARTSRRSGADHGEEQGDGAAAPPRRGVRDSRAPQASSRRRSRGISSRSRSSGAAAWRTPSRPRR